MARDPMRAGHVDRALQEKPHRSHKRVGPQEWTGERGHVPTAPSRSEHASEASRRVRRSPTDAQHKTVVSCPGNGDLVGVVPKRFACSSDPSFPALKTQLAGGGSDLAGSAEGRDVQFNIVAPLQAASVGSCRVMATLGEPAHHFGHVTGIL
ncbi:MAG: hypothetical protein ACJAXA_000775 [Candidatus Aldehydirespiratoraceae bacterium]|jgi:hypothetical protein